MNNLNSVMIEGNMTADPSLKSTPNGIPVCTFSMAFNKYFPKESGREPEVSFFDVQTWSKLAENCSQLGHKGRGVRVTGRLKQERWNDSEGKNHSRICIVAEQVEFRPEKSIGYAPGNARQDPAGSPGFPQYRQQSVPVF